MNKRIYRKFTNEEDQVIISMRKEGKTNKEIASFLKRKVGGINYRCKVLIDQCKIEKRGPLSKVDYTSLGEYVSNNPGNIRQAIRDYAEDNKLSFSTVKSAYYDKRASRTRVKDRGFLFTLVGSKGHTINNSKNTEKIVKSNLWNTIKKKSPFTTTLLKQIKLKK